MSKKVLAVILSLILCFSAVAVPVGAADISLPETSVENVFNYIIDRLIHVVLSYLNMYWPGYEGSWDTEEDYQADNFYTGDTEFDYDVKGASEWNLGYAGVSLLDGISVMNGKYFLAGSLEIAAGRVPSQVLDDQRVRVYAINDGVGGTVVHAVIDGFGLPRGDVEEIRARLAEFAAANNIESLNVSVLHQHSCIDTLGMNIPLLQGLLANTGNAASGGLIESMKVQKNAEFMENLYTKTVYAIKKAVKSMEPGKLYYGAADISDYIRDKRDPQAFDPNINRLRFVPEDGSKETWILEAAVHCTGNGAGGDVLTADYPYYIEKAINKEANDGVGANVVFVLGAELAIGMRTVRLCLECQEVAEISKPATEDGIYEISCPSCGKKTVADDDSEFTTEDAQDYAATVDAWYKMNTPENTKNDFDLKDYGYSVAKRVMDIDPADEVELEPVLNIAHQEVALEVENQILTLAAREDILNAVIVKSGTGYKMITEIGYMELGGDSYKVGTFLCPGEFDPILIYGGPESGEAGWIGDDWSMPALKDVTDCDTVLAFGLMNDQAGYVLRDNEYHSLLSENEEVNVLTPSAGSTFVSAYMDLLAEIKD